MKRVTVGAIAMSLMALAVPAVAGSARAAEPDALMSLNAAASRTLDQSAAGVSMEFFTEEANQYSFTTTFAATPARYDENIQVGNGKGARLGVNNQGEGYVTANLIPLPSVILRGAGLTPDSTVTFHLGWDRIGELQEMARLPVEKLAEYAAYSPAGMWEDLTRRQAAGEVTLTPRTPIPAPDSGTRYQIDVSAPGDPADTFLFTAEVSRDGLLRYARAEATDLYVMESTLISLGDRIAIPAAPAATRPWMHIEAAQWRDGMQERITRLGQQAKERIQARARAEKRPATVALAREQARRIADATTISGTSVKAWNIRSGVRIEVRRANTTGHIWTVGTCLQVRNGTVSASLC